MLKAFGYLRVSGKSQVDTDGFPRQRLAIEGYAAEHDIEVCGYFEEKALCGKTEWEDRPAWVEMLRATNGIKTIVIERLDRLARDLMVQEHILADLKQRGIELISTNEPDLGSEDATRVLMRHIVGAVAQYDRTMTVLKLKGARDRKKAECRKCKLPADADSHLDGTCVYAPGKCEGAHAFGKHPDKPEEKRALELMVGLRGGGMSTPDIAAALNRNGFGTRHEGGEWFASSVSRILRRVAAK